MLSPMNRNPRFLAAVLTIAIICVLPATAVAQGADGYMPPGPGIVQDTEPPPSSSEPSNTEPPPGDSQQPPSAAPSPSGAPGSPGAQPAPAQQAVQTGGLPFTGLDLGLIALAGLAVLALGLGLRRLSPARSALR